MSWVRAYGLVLHLLPAELRRKHGVAMETLFAGEVERARTSGWLYTTHSVVTAFWDVLRRSAYERLRERHNAVEKNGVNRPRHEPTLPTPDSPLMPDVRPTPRPPRLATRELLGRHATSFGVAFAAFTTVLLVVFARRQLPELSARGASNGTMAKALLLAVPFNMALTIPIAVLVAVLWEFTRLNTDGALTVARGERRGLQRLIIPVIGAATGVAALAFVVCTELVPRANARLVTVLAIETSPPNDRTMTIGELRDAVRALPAASEPVAVVRAARYEVEIQKKLALPAACVVLALAGMAIALTIPRGGAGLVAGASGAILTTYYLMMVTGERLASRLVVSPLVGMWGANALILAATLLLTASSRRMTWRGVAARRK